MPFLPSAYTYTAVKIDWDFAFTSPFRAMNQAVKEVAVTIMGKLNSLPEASSERCIILVPEKFRRANPESYTPQIVSIGPFHRKNKQLQAKEEIKLRYNW